MSAMPAAPVEGLRELHDDYTWEVNAAIGRGEDRQVERLVREYTDLALRLLTRTPSAS